MHGLKCPQASRENDLFHPNTIYVREQWESVHEDTQTNLNYFLSNKKLSREIKRKFSIVPVADGKHLLVLVHDNMVQRAIPLPCFLIMNY